MRQADGLHNAIGHKSQRLASSFSSDTSEREGKKGHDGNTGRTIFANEYEGIIGR